MKLPRLKRKGAQLLKGKEATADPLDAQFEPPRRAFGAYGFMVKRATYHNLLRVARRGFCIPEVDGSQGEVVLSDYVRRLYPFASEAASMPRDAFGPYLGPILPTGEPCFLMPQQGPHFVIVGPTGAGKTLAAVVIAQQLVDLEGRSALYLDPGDAYRYLGDRAKILMFNTPKGPQFDFLKPAGPLPEWKRKVLSITESALGLDSPLQKQAAWESMQEAYAGAGMHDDRPETWSREPPRPSDWLRAVRKRRNEAAASGNQPVLVVWQTLEQKLKLLTQEGPYGAVFDGPGSLGPEDFQGRVLVLNTSRVQDKFVRRLIHLFALAYARHYLPELGRDLVVVVDEAWMFFKRGSSSVGMMLLNELEEAARMGRKERLALITITQDVDDFSTDAIDFVSNADTFLVFNLKRAQIPAARKLLPEMPERWEARLPHFERGECLVAQTGLPGYLHVKVDASVFLPRKEAVDRHGPPHWPASGGDELVGIFRLIQERKIVKVSELPPLKKSDRVRMKERYPVGYVTVGAIGRRGAKVIYAYDSANVKTPRHDAWVAELCTFLRGQGFEPEASKTVEVDVTFTAGGKQVAVEVFLGTRSPSEFQKQLEEQVSRHGSVLVLCTEAVKQEFSRKVQVPAGARLLNQAEFAEEIRRFASKK